ncbi:TiaS agmantine-binding domain-containing protein [Methanocaldococcus indicus]|uniref:TiaS agmantine-binding domain-containing protein n=1 Tax=Methanocaldococcus indicus TaxID=213231 RepID=UPI003C6D2254
MFIGIDDTDSRRKLCTTYLATLLYEELKNNGFILDIPKLIRFNPSVKYKTRGNGGVSLRILNYKREDFKFIKDLVIDFVEKYSDLEDENTNPGVVFLEHKNYKNHREILKNYYKEVLYNIVDVDYAEKIIKLVNGYSIKYKLGRGIIGALGAISSTPPYTYELIAYRYRDRWGTKRIIDEDSVIKMDKETFPYTFDNYDYENKKILITPNTPCPVLYGIRGIDIKYLIDAHFLVKGEKSERFLIFKTNHGTDAHLRYMKIKDIYPNTGVIVYGYLSEEPKNLEGGHVKFKLKDDTGEIDCIAYEPTKKFRDIIRELIVGDYIAVYGTVREKPLTINIEKIKILKLAEKFEYIKECPLCGGTLKSKGRTTFKCKKCKSSFNKESVKKIIVERNIKIGFYEVPPSARRHLSKPIQLIDLIS